MAELFLESGISEKGRLKNRITFQTAFNSNPQNVYMLGYARVLWIGALCRQGFAAMKGGCVSNGGRGNS